MRYVYAADGNVAASIDSSGRVTLGAEPGAIVGLVRGQSDVFGDEAGAQWLGRIDPDGRIVDTTYDMVGSVDVNGRIFDQTGRLLGKADVPVDGAVLMLIVTRIAPQLFSFYDPPEETASTKMDEALELAEEQSVPGIRKHYRPLTDADVLGVPHTKQPKQ